MAMTLQEILARNRMAAGGATAQHFNPADADSMMYMTPDAATLVQGLQGHTPDPRWSRPDPLQQYFDMIQQGYQPQGK